MKVIHLKCGHNIQVRTWPSSAGLVKVRHHYKKFHPKRMKKMTRKSLVTKRKRGLIKNRCNPKKYDPKYFGMTKKQFYKAVKMGHDPYQMASIKKSDPKMFKRMLRMDIISKRNPVGKPTVIYDRLLGIEAHKSHGKFKGQNFEHDFRNKTDAMVLGNPDGSLTIRSKKGKPLWRKFKY